MIATSKLFRTASLTFTFLTAMGTAASADGQPGANPVQAKYIARTGATGAMCAPQGLLKEIVAGKYACYAASGGDACGASLDAAKGKLDPKYNALFVDLMKTDPTIKKTEGNPKGHLYAAGCNDMAAADFAHMLSPSALSYGKASPDALLAFGTPENFEAWSAQQREDFVAAVGRYGEPQKARALPILRTALATKGSMLNFKKNALKLMARFGSDDGVAYCTDVLKQGTDKDVSVSCALYLGERKNLAAVPLLVRRLDDDIAFTRALGLIGSKEAAATLKASYEKQVGSVTALESTVALLDVGDKSYDYAGDLVAMIQGRRPLSLRDREKKASELKSKRKGAAERWKQREEEVHEEVASAAALEATYVTDATASAKVDTALRATAKRTAWSKASSVATSALAQRGDRAAAAALVQLLASPNSDVRDLAVNAFGASYDVPDAFTVYVGRKGVVADPSAPSALIAYIDNEPNADKRAKALRALGAVRSFLP